MSWSPDGQYHTLLTGIATPVRVPWSFHLNFSRVFYPDYPNKIQEINPLPSPKPTSWVPVYLSVVDSSLRQLTRSGSAGSRRFKAWVDDRAYAADHYLFC